MKSGKLVQLIVEEIKRSQYISIYFQNELLAVAVQIIANKFSSMFFINHRLQIHDKNIVIFVVGVALIAQKDQLQKPLLYFFLILNPNFLCY